MRLRTILVVAGAIATLSGSALATTLGPDPTAVVLRKSDFPTKSKYNAGRMPALFGRGLASSLGIKAEGAFLAVEMPLSATKYQRIDGLVVTTASPTQAKKAYGAFKSELSRGSSARLPAFGDEQVVVLEPSVSRAKLLVRKGRVVWQLEVGGYGLLVIPRGTLLAELQKYAKKQKTRVGAG